MGVVKDVESFVRCYTQRFQVHKRNVCHIALHYLKGLLQARQRNMEKMAEVIPHSNQQALQQFLSDSPWDYHGVMEQVAGDANALLGGNDSALLIDETAVAKKGQKSVGVARQWSGRLGKVDNCQVGVFAALTKGSDNCLIDAQLYLPQSWIDDPARCEKARVPVEQRHLHDALGEHRRPHPPGADG